jgi:ankyrin repeat protein
LLDILLEGNDVINSQHTLLSTTLRDFVTRRVTAPKTRAADKHVEDKLRVLKHLDFYHDLKHAIIYHRDFLKGSTNDTEEGVLLTLFQHIGNIRSIIEKMITSGSADHIQPLYGQDLFKCSKFSCESFHVGFSTPKARDIHRDLHDRIYMCSVVGCPSATIGFGSLLALQRHEQDYHEERKDEISFPWHGTVTIFEIAEKIKNGNYAAFEFWLSRLRDMDSIWKLPSRDDPLRIAAIHNQNKMLQELLIRYATCNTGDRGETAVYECIKLGNDEGVRILMKGIPTLKEKVIYRLFTSALRAGKDDIAKEILRHPSSGVHGEQTPGRKESYLNLALRFGRDSSFIYILETYQVNPEQQDRKGRTSLYTAAEYDRIEIAAYLVKTKGCNRWHNLSKGATPLSMAGKQGHEEFIRSIYPLENEDVARENSAQIQRWLRVAQLRNAARNGDVLKLKELLYVSVVDLDELDTQSRSPWSFAVEGGYERIVELLLTTNTIAFNRPLRSVHGRWRDGPNALHIVAFSGDESIMRLLLQSGKFDKELDRRCIYVRESGRRETSASGTALDIAKSRGLMDMVKLLEDYTSTLAKRSNDSTENVGRVHIS